MTASCQARWAAHACSSCRGPQVWGSQRPADPGQPLLGKCARRWTARPSACTVIPYTLQPHAQAVSQDPELRAHQQAAQARRPRSWILQPSDLVEKPACRRSARRWTAPPSASCSRWRLARLCPGTCTWSQWTARTAGRSSTSRPCAGWMRRGATASPSCRCWCAGPAGHVAESRVLPALRMELCGHAQALCMGSCAALRASGAEADVAHLAARIPV